MPARPWLFVSVCSVLIGLFAIVSMKSAGPRLRPLQPVYINPTIATAPSIHTATSSLTVPVPRAAEAHLATSTHVQTTTIVRPPQKHLSQTAAAAAVMSHTPNSTQTGATKSQDSYSTPPLSIIDTNTLARNALVNIICTTSGGSIKPISGSGVIIDPRGIILTNAHVAQYVLLSESPDFHLTCTVRMGSPARPVWKASVLYMPTAWVDAHVKDINVSNPTGTGEHDYALLLVTQTADGTPRPETGFPFLPFDTRETIGVPGEQVLAASYPAEYLDGIEMENDLYAATSPAMIDTLLTFGSGSVDLYSIGGIIEAQSGSSGGAVVNPWGRVIGLIVTASPGTTTAARDLHALTLSYINRDFIAQTGASLSNYISGDIILKFEQYYKNSTAPLLQQYYNVLSQ